MSGAIQPDEGELRLDGEPAHFRSPGDARKLGIETVYQDLAVAPALDIATNIFLGRERRRRGIARQTLRVLDKGGMRRDAARNFAELKIGIRSIDKRSRRSPAGSVRASPSHARPPGRAAS